MSSRADDGASVPIHLRLSRAAWVRYSTEAAALSQSLASYLRQRLEREDELVAELASIRRALENSSASSASTAATSTPAGASPSMLLEVLLLCRSLAQHQRTETVQAEVRRLGLEVWQPPTTTR
jgi:hypothetical protein